MYDNGMGVASQKIEKFPNKIDNINYTIKRIAAEVNYFISLSWQLSLSNEITC